MTLLKSIDVGAGKSTVHADPFWLDQTQKIEEQLKFVRGTRDPVALIRGLEVLGTEAKAEMLNKQELSARVLQIMILDPAPAIKHLAYKRIEFNRDNR